MGRNIQGLRSTLLAFVIAGCGWMLLGIGANPHNGRFPSADNNRVSCFQPMAFGGFRGIWGGKNGKSRAPSESRRTQTAREAQTPRAPGTEQYDSEKSRKKKAVRAHTVQQLNELLDGRGLRLFEVDVRGDGTQALLDSSDVHPVAAAIHQRMREGSKPGQRTDGIKIALALEGGGMRGSVGAGMLAALNHLGYEDAFDVVYGSSAGSLMGCYFLSGQTPYEGPGIYYDVLSGAGPQFIDRRQLMRSIGLGVLDLRRENYQDMLRGDLGKPVLNLDFLLGKVVADLMPLNWEKFWERQLLQPLKVVASALLSKQAVVLSSSEGNFNNLDELTECMRASMLLPGIAGPLVRIHENRTGSSLDRTYWSDGLERDARGQRVFRRGSEPLCDALLFEPIPYRSAIKEKCTHILVLRTRPDGVRVTGKMSFFEKRTYKRFFKRKNEMPGIAQWMIEQKHKRIYAEDILLLNAQARERDSERGRPGHPHLMPVALHPTMPEINRLEMRREVLLEGVRNGFAVAYDLMVADPAQRGKGEEIAREVFHDGLKSSSLIGQNAFDIDISGGKSDNPEVTEVYIDPDTGGVTDIIVDTPLLD